MPNDTLPERLTQQQASALIGRKPSWLRDRPDAPRDADGSYSARALVRWAIDLAAPATLTDDELERLLIVTGPAIDGMDGRLECAEFVNLVDQLAAKYGKAALLAVVATSIDCAKERVARSPGDYAGLPTSFDHVLQCEECERYRQGRRWIKHEPAPELRVVAACCPTCLAKPSIGALSNV